MPTPWNPDVRLKICDGPSPIKPYDYQIAAWDALTKCFLDLKKRAGLIVVPTGGGKTVLAAHWLLEHHIRNGGRVLWLAHRRGLLRQALKTFMRLGNVAFPRETLNLMCISSSDAKWANVAREHDAVFASMQTAVLEANRGFIEVMREDSPKGLFVVVDEAHHAPAPGYSRLLKELKGQVCPLLGLTATPVRMNDEGTRLLSFLFDKEVIYQITRRELTHQGILAVAAFETVETHVNMEKDFTPEDYKYLEKFGELGPAVLARLSKHALRNKLIVEHYLKKKDIYGPTIVFAGDAAHALTLADEFKKAGVNADHVDYTRKDAPEIIQNYQEKKGPDVIVNVEMLTEGFDAPHTRTVFIARPTRSEGLLTQMVGRALRGKRSEGNETAYLVTFVDTWEQFNVLDAEYVLAGPEETPDVEPPPPEARGPLIPISVELIREAYRLLHSNVKGQLVGVFQCLPLGWYTWEEPFDDDVQRRSVMVFDNQAEEMTKLVAEFATPESVPAEVSEDFARDLVRKYFIDVADPRPRWADVKALLDARRKGCEIFWYTFEEKKSFDPVTIAKIILEKKLDPDQQSQLLQDIWKNQPACSQVYRGDQLSFFEDVDRAVRHIKMPPKPQVEPEVEKIVPKGATRAWPPDHPGYALVAIRDAVLGVKRNFPNGSPLVSDLQWSKQPNKRLWGFFRYSDKCISLNCALNSPDIPRYVVEFLMFHELLHADMPGAGHNKDFRARERLFEPSAEAVEEAAKLGIRRGTSLGYWRARADMFLDTFHRYYAHKKPGSEMDL